MKHCMLARAKCVSSQPRPLKLSMTGSFGRNAQQVKNGNFKSALQEFVQQRWPSLPVSMTVAYDAVMNDDGWMSTVRILPNNRAFPSGMFASKKAAEQDAAKKAY